ncbi:hypothetical protein H4F47_10435 [Pectobacterium brasiliense]|uniref:hypothetical protein n=1 Tax=Pectobacterium brasiliense TaxID=180957 RepID=UPI0019694256|nr:hypothetical protein [Pectobacterium brasiliense]MBN3043335.1 hypothetical protein [Pectobacterium brasiliense]
MKYLSGIVIDAIVIMSLLFGYLYSIDGLTNIGYFAGWLFGTIGLLGFSVTSVRETAEKKYTHQPLIWRIYDAATDIAYVAFAVYSGWFVLATVFALQGMCKAQFKSEQEKRIIEEKNSPDKE